MPKLIIGQPAPDFQLPDLEGNPTRLGDLRGMAVLVVFWSAECPWVERVDCEVTKLQSPNLAQLAIASNSTEPPDLLRQVAKARQLPRLLLDTDHQVADLYNAETTPHFFLVDSQGILRYQGAFDDTSFRNRTPTRAYLREAIEALECGREIEVTETPPFGCSIIRFSE